jgi:hypothetical protein
MFETRALSRRHFCRTLATGCLAAASSQLLAADNSKDAAMLAAWKKLSKFEAAELARRNVHGLVRAAHGYHEAHGSLPPAVIANPKLPAGKRLSGLVLLLPHLDQKSWMERGTACFDEKTVQLGKTLYESIDQSKAWDDPAILEAARTLVPAFLAPQSGEILDEDGFAVSHFAFVSGNSEGTNGAFPGERAIKIASITDGTVSTLGFGQVNSELGPWIAEGLGTARQLFAATKNSPASFGSEYGKGAMFATVDSMAGYFPINEKTQPILQQMGTRSGGELFEFKQLRQENPFDK